MLFATMREHSSLSVATMHLPAYPLHLSRPLSIAIASDADPKGGLIRAIIARLVISLLGGSRVLALEFAIIGPRRLCTFQMRLKSQLYNDSRRSVLN